MEGAGVCRPDAASLWILNQSLLIINELELYDANPRCRTYPAHGLSMAQFSVRGACGFVLVAMSYTCPFCSRLERRALIESRVTLASQWRPRAGK